MKKIVYIASHLSTGGMPQYLVKQVESIKDDMDVYCIEWENVTGGVLVVQRNKVVNLLGDKLITLGEDKNELFRVLDHIQPDIVHLQEIPELFMQKEMADKLYATSRKYAIIETSHDSGYNIDNKTYLPDKFLMVSMFQVEKYKVLGIPVDLVEYPIENKVRTKTREQALRDLGLDPNLKHVINVGLFTPRKNQAEIIEYARQLQNYPIQFHFIGNQADNFKFYWEPLMKNLPPNCKWWNERSDVDSFYEAADLFLFTSRGSDTDRETMPLVIREALGWKVPSLIYNLPVYMGYFDKYDTIEYLTESLQKNAYRIAEKLLREKIPYIEEVKSSNTPTKDCIVISAYPITEASAEITKESILRAKKFNLPIILTSHCAVPEEIQKLADYCLVDKNNILTYHTYYCFGWFNYPGISAKLNLRGEGNHIYHGPAAYTNYYNGVAFAQNLGFDNVYCWNYDVLLNDDTLMTAMKTALETHKMVIRYYPADEGPTLQTLILGTNSDFFMKHFPKINNEQEYTDWTNRVGAESNGLENIWYHTVKNNLNEVRMWSNDEYLKLAETSETEICSRVEYVTILPVENDDTQAVAWYSSNNVKDSKVLRLYINNELADTLDINTKMYYYRPFSLADTRTVQFEVSDSVNGNIVINKIIQLNEEYITNKLKDNGLFKYENS